MRVLLICALCLGLTGTFARAGEPVPSAPTTEPQLTPQVAEGETIPRDGKKILKPSKKKTASPVKKGSSLKNSAGETATEEEAPVAPPVY